MEKTAKTAYICGPLTDLPADEQERVKATYVLLADLCEELLGVRAFVPHEHCDPIRHAELMPFEVDAIERRQVSESSCLIAVDFAPSWGGGIEVEIARNAKVPVILLIPEGRRSSRLLRGNPGIEVTVSNVTPRYFATALKQAFSRLNMIG